MRWTGMHTYIYLHLATTLKAHYTSESKAGFLLQKEEAIRDSMPHLYKAAVLGTESCKVGKFSS